ncbi:hypothetical protein L7F22_015150 [Adiantum nelumboides]|nr:hypothetical protein [Adiantum nelumboides]
MDGYREEGSSSQDRQPISSVHEVGEGSSQVEEAFRIRLVNNVILFKHLIEKPRFMEFLQSPLMPQQVQEHSPLSQYVETQLQVPTVSQKGKEHSYAGESCETPKENLSVQEQVIMTPVLQAISNQPATLKSPNAGSNGQDIMFQDMHPVLPPSSVHSGYFEGGSVFQSMAGYALENQQCMLGTMFGDLVFESSITIDGFAFKESKTAPLKKFVEGPSVSEEHGRGSVADSAPAPSRKNSAKKS